MGAGLGRQPLGGSRGRARARVVNVVDLMRLQDEGGHTPG